MTKLLQNTYVRYGLIGLISLILGLGIGHFAKPAKIITKTEYKEVIKEVSIKKEQKNVVVVTRKITKKDGTIIEETKSQDKTSTIEDKKRDSRKELASSTITTRDIGLSVHALAMQNINLTERSREYGIFVKKRVIGNISVGGLVTDQKTIGFSLGMDF